MTSRCICVATVQMDIRPGTTGDRLFRVDQILCDAVELGAQLVVLPSFFNTGFAYQNENFERAEYFLHPNPGVRSGKEDGPTIHWMKKTAHRLGIHLAGSLLLFEEGEIYHAMILAAPDGRLWRYDQSYPWGWESAYVRPNRQTGPERAVIAHTDLGDLGMMVGWDVAHTELYRAYAGQVDMLLVSSFPPPIQDSMITFSAGTQVNTDQLGAAWTAFKDENCQVFTEMVQEQAAWLQTPIAQGSACGSFQSAVPNGLNMLLGLLPGAPGLVRYLSKANEAVISANIPDATQIISAQGGILARLPQAKGEGFILADVDLPDQKGIPTAAQPASRASKSTYFLGDTYLPRVIRSVYNKGIQSLRERRK